MRAFIILILILVNFVAVKSVHANGMTCRALLRGVLQSEVRANEIRFLNEVEYRQLVKKKGILMNTVLVIERLPLDVDLPVVAAIVTRDPLRSAFSHPENQAAALEIPIWTSISLFEKVKNLQKNSNQYVQISHVGSEYFVRIHRGQLPVVKSKLSVLPLDYNRSARELIEVDDPRAMVREIVGDKFADMAANRFLDKSRPDIIGMTSGYFESFLDSFGVSGVSLRELRFKMLQEMNHVEMTDTDVEAVLSRFRDQIKKVEPLPGANPSLNELFFALQGRFPGLVDFSFRSSTDIEGVLNTAGLFSSFRVNLKSEGSLKRLFQDVLIAMYSPRSVQIRRRMGILEKNLSMPMMVHPYIHNVVAHGIAKFSQPKNGYLADIEFSVVLGATEKATNPSAVARVLSFTMNDKVEDPNTSSIVHTAQAYFKNKNFEIREAIQDRLYGKGHAEFEFIILSSENGEAAQLMILQFAVPLALEATAGVLQGNLSKDKVFARKKLFHVQSVEDFRRFNRLKSLNEMIESPIRFQANGHRGPRFALIQKEDQPPEFIFWTDGILHENMIDYVRKSGFKYLVDGYASVGKLGEVSFYPPAFGVMHGWVWIKYRELFVGALQRETQSYFFRNGQFRSWDSIKSFAIFFKASGRPGDSESFVWTP